MKLENSKNSLKLDGMTCATCTLTVKKYFEKKGYDDIQVDLMTGNVTYKKGKAEQTMEELKKGITNIGYSVLPNENNTIESPKNNSLLKGYLSKCIFSLIFTLPLFLHMSLDIEFLHYPYIQLLLTIPVLILGSINFGKSAIRSIINKTPNMDVLIFVGASSAFIYSLIGAIILGNSDYLFFETTATIYTLVFFGNWLESKSMETTNREMNKLIKKQEIKAKMIAFDDKKNENTFEVDANSLKIGDLVLIQAGDIIPTDCKILSGKCSINESIITGESTLISKTKKDTLIGGSLLENGTIKAIVTANQEDTVLNKIIQLAQESQNETPPIQHLADKISAIFIPTVLSIASLTFLINFFFFNIDLTNSLMRSIAVMVIACPCALGLATPAALSVGLGISVKKGILFKNAKVLNLFSKIKTCFFDKTGTLTLAEKNISKFEVIDISEDEMKSVVLTAEQQSNHPIANTIKKAWSNSKTIKYHSIEEVRGKGIILTDTNDNIWHIGSPRFNQNKQELPKEKTIYIFKNLTFAGWIDIDEKIKEDADKVIHFLKSKNITPILLSGDNEEKCLKVAHAIGINKIYYSQTPESKQKIITKYRKKGIVAMIGDGINDAPSLSKADIGISIQGASQLALRSSDVVIFRQGMQTLGTAFLLGKKTYGTIKGNLAWAFSYNIVAIPIAAAGFLSPTFGALIMGFSDVILAINSVLLFSRKIKL